MTAAHDGRPATIQAFDRLAAEYDEIAAGEIFRLLRDRTHRVFDQLVPFGSRYLEIGCGTGMDTRFLASRCRQVVACDPSEEMVTRTLRRISQDGRDQVVTVMPCGLDDVQSYLDALVPHESFDGIVSNFGALNCVCSLAPLGVVARRYLRPGGVLLLGLMTRVCATEAMYFACTRRPRLAARRLAAGAVQVPVAGIQVPTFYHRIRDVRDALGAGVRLRQVLGVGVAIPPPYLESRWQQLAPRVRRAVAAVDALLAPWPPFNRLGDHVLLHFIRDAAHG